MPSAQASSTQVKSPGFIIYDNSNGLNIRQPATVGVALGVTDIMTELR